MARKSEVSVTLSNLQVLDCKVCNQPLTIPVYQCKNGHTACKTCCERLESKCPTCKLEIHSKCLPLEEIIQSLKVPCQNKDYGCKELISYCNTIDHEKNCVYECYPCPQPACQFRGLSSQLSDHFCTIHYTKTFEYNRSFDLELWKNQKIYVLEETASGDVFVLNNETAKFDGNKITISFVSPMPPLSGKVVEVKATAGSNFLKLFALTPTARSISDKPQAPALLHISSDFLELNDSFWIILKLRPVPESVDGVLVDEDVDAKLEMEKTKVKDLQKELESLRKDIKSKNAMDVKLEMEKTKVKDLQKELESLRKDISSKNAVDAKLEMEKTKVKDLQKKLESLQKDIRSKNAMDVKLEMEKTKVKDLQKELESLRNDIRYKKARIDKLRKKLGTGSITKITYG